MTERSGFFQRKIRRAGEAIVSGTTTLGAIILCPGDDIAMSALMFTDTVGHEHVQQVSLPPSGNFTVKEPPFVQVKHRKHLQKFKRVT